MAQQESSGNSGIAFIVGALVVIVAVLGYFVLGGKISGGGDKDINVKIDVPEPKKSQ